MRVSHGAPARCRGGNVQRAMLAHELCARDGGSAVLLPSEDSTILMELRRRVSATDSELSRAERAADGRHR